MIRLKENVDEKVLEQYGFRKRYGSCTKIVYTYSFIYHRPVNFQSVDVYITPFINAWGETIYHAREVVAHQHAYECDKAVNLIAKLITEGIFEYVESEKNDTGIIKEPRQGSRNKVNRSKSTVKTKRACLSQTRRS